MLESNPSQLRPQNVTCVYCIYMSCQQIKSFLQSFNYRYVLHLRSIETKRWVFSVCFIGDRKQKRKVILIRIGQSNWFRLATFDNNNNKKKIFLIVRTIVFSGYWWLIGENVKLTEYIGKKYIMSIKNNNYQIELLLSIDKSRLLLSSWMHFKIQFFHHWISNWVN